MKNSELIEHLQQHSPDADVFFVRTTRSGRVVYLPDGWLVHPQDKVLGIMLEKAATQMSLGPWRIELEDGTVVEGDSGSVTL